MENLIKLDDIRVPPFWETSIWVQPAIVLAAELGVLQPAGNPGPRPETYASDMQLWRAQWKVITAHNS